VQDNTICAVLFVAKGAGYFRDEGLDVSLVRYPSGKLALKGMFAGESDVAACADMPIMIHSLSRSDFAVFGTVASTYNGAWIIARTDRDISAPDDMAGKTIGTQENSAVHFFLSAFLLRHGIPETNVTIRFMKAVDLPQALADGEIDAFSMRNPFVQTAKDALRGEAIEFFGKDVYQQTFNLVAHKAYLAGHPDVVCRILRALVRAEALINGDENRAKAAAVAAMGSDREAEVAADWGRYTYRLSLDQALFLTLEDQARWKIKRSPSPELSVPNYADFVDVSHLDAVRPEAVTVIR